MASWQTLVEVWQRGDVVCCEGVTVKESTFFALASDSSTDRAANKQELVYTRTVSIGKTHTAFLGLHDLHDGSAEGILAAFKQVMLRARFSVEEWISRVFWYRVDGAVVMQSTEKGVAGLLMQLQRDVLGHSMIVPIHANCHCADLAFRDAMDSSHEFLDVVGNTMNLAVTWYNNAPTRLRNMRRMSCAVDLLPLSLPTLVKATEMTECVCAYTNLSHLFNTKCQT